MRLLGIFLLSIFLISCGSRPKGNFNDQVLKGIPDYSNESNWAALPWRDDNADLTPKGFEDNQNDAEVDVFFLHPTNYYGERGYDRWNAPIDLKSINEGVDNVSIKYQATAFNGAGKVYAPRYRQAHLRAYYSKDTTSAKKALDLAYKDVKEAFAYYMSNYNNGRPFIIASHSQGTTHAKRLIIEYIDGKPLQKKLVAAYLIGIPVNLSEYKSIKACDSPYATSCLIGWRTWKRDSKPKYLQNEVDKDILVTNPLSWKIDNDYVSAKKNKGGIILDVTDSPLKELTDAQVYKSILWASKPEFKGSWLIRSKNYHRGDINLYYINIRENAEQRAKSYLKIQ